MSETAIKHPSTFTPTRLRFLATQLLSGRANEGDISEAATDLAYVAHLLDEGAFVVIPGRKNGCSEGRGIGRSGTDA